MKFRWKAEKQSGAGRYDELAIGEISWNDDGDGGAPALAIHVMKDLAHGADRVCLYGPVDADTPASTPWHDGDVYYAEEFADELPDGEIED